MKDVFFQPAISFWLLSNCELAAFLCIFSKVKTNEWDFSLAATKHNANKTNKYIFFAQLHLSKIRLLYDNLIFYHSHTELQKLKRKSEQDNRVLFIRCMMGRTTRMENFVEVWGIWHCGENTNCCQKTTKCTNLTYKNSFFVTMLELINLPQLLFFLQIIFFILHNKLR